MVGQKLKRPATAFACLLLPKIAKPLVLRGLGHTVPDSARIGFSLIWVDKLLLGERARIGGFNLVSVRRLVMRSGAYIGSMNIIRGHFSVWLKDVGAIGNRNVIGGDRSGLGPPVCLKLGKISKLTAGHYVNLSASIVFGDYSTLAGSGSQIWTHGFVHFATGPGREEVRGKVTIGHNVYIGSMSCIGPGITIGDAVSIGAHSSVAQSLLQPGAYVTQKLRYIEKAPEERLAALEVVGDGTFRWRDGGGPYRP